MSTVETFIVNGSPVIAELNGAGTRETPAEKASVIRFPDCDYKFRYFEYTTSRYFIITGAVFRKDGAFLPFRFVNPYNDCVGDMYSFGPAGFTYTVEYGDGDRLGGDPIFPEYESSDWTHILACGIELSRQMPSLWKTKRIG